MHEFSIQTRKHTEFQKIDAQLAQAVKASGIQRGVAHIFVPHTTAGVTINENADPDVVSDFLLGLDAAFPDRADFTHGEGNSSAHLKASAVGSSVQVIVSGGRLVLGTWQGIYFCEFDGPRSRNFIVKVM